MKEYFICFLLSVLLVFTSIAAKSQSSSLKGKIYDDSNLPAESVTVSLLKFPDSLLVKSVISNAKGDYFFGKITPGKYLLRVSKSHYQKTITGPFIIIADKINVANAKLMVESRTLQEVFIRDQKRYIDVRPDRTILNVDRDILATGASILSVLGNAPGVKVNNNGDVMLRAGQKATVLVNGKQVKLVGTDLASFLQNMQSSDVDRIELIPNPSAKYEAAGAGGAINIILKKGDNYGFNGTATGTVGYGRFGKGGTGFTGNYQTNKVNIFGSANYNYDETFHTITYDRSVNDARHTSFDTRYYATQKTPKFDYRIGTDVFLDSLHTIGFLIYGSTSISQFDKQTDTHMYLNGVLDSSSNTISNLKRHSANTEYNLNYSGAIGRNQVLSADINVASNYRRSYEDLVTRQLANTTFKSLLAQFNNSTLSNIAPTNIINQAFKIDYVNLLSKADKFEAGVKGSHVNNDNYQYFGLLQNNTYVPYARLTSHFLYKEDVASAYVNFSHTGKVFSYTTGLRFESTKSDANEFSSRDIKRTYNNFYPSLQAVYNFKHSLLMFEYNRRIVPLDYLTVNPIINYQDNYNIRMGNPYLQPAYTNNLQLTYDKNSLFKISAYSNNTRNFFDFTYFIQDDVSRVLISTKTNLKSYSNNGITLDVPQRISKWWNVNFNIDASYQHFRDYNGLLDKGTKDIILKLDQRFVIAKTLTANLHGQYESSTFYGISALRPNYSVSSGISKQFSKATTLTLSALDIFNTDRDRYQINFANLNLSSYDKRETQRVRLTFVYRFGKKTVAATRKHFTGNEDEIKRMSTSAN